MNNKKLYKGISFKNFDRNKSIKIFDEELIKKDLLNAINTRRGSRVKMFTYGTRIPDFLFEGLTDIIIEGTYDDLLTVFRNEPRVELRDLKITPIYEQHVLLATATLYYLELNFTGEFDIRLSFGA